MDEVYEILNLLGCAMVLFQNGERICSCSPAFVSTSPVIPNLRTENNAA